MKIWEVELKDKKTPAKNHADAPIIDTMQVVGDDYDLAARNALEQTKFDNVIATSVRLIAETSGD